MPQSVKFIAICEEFPARHTAPLAEGYRRQSRRLCDVGLRLRRAGINRCVHIAVLMLLLAAAN